MVTQVGTKDDFSAVLKDLMELDRDAADAYQAAIDRLESAEFKSRLEAFKADHLRHVEEVAELLRAKGEQPPDPKASAGSGLKSMVAQGKVALGSMAGDKQILQAMKTNEDDTNTAYERVVGHPGRTPDAAPIVERGLADERRHRDWIETTLSRL